MVIKWDVTIPKLSGENTRKAYIYLPRSYKKNPEHRYPVLYMFDGHNVFFDEDATYGKSWGMKKYLDRTNKELIVVAVECNHEGNRRMVEYSPVNYSNDRFGTVKGQGKAYMDWTVKVLKPYIDQHYRTLPDRMNTLIAGSSMGGLMALYAVCAYNSVFQRAACLSPSLWLSPDEVMEMIVKSKVHKDSIIYMDYGEQEMANHSPNREALITAAHLLLIKQVNITFRIAPGGDHSEASWEKQIPIFMDCLGL